MQADSFMEEFALAGEQQRAELLTKLVPNSNEFYHYSLIHLLNTDKRNTKEFDHLWDAYKKTKGSSTLHNYLEIARSLKGPTSEALQFLKERFSLTYDHVKSEYLPATYPSRLDESWQEAAIQASLAKNNDYTSEFTPMADVHMLDVDDPIVQQAALSRLTVPNHDNLVPLIAEDILSNKRDFSSFSVHLSLTLSQLDQLLSLVPDLIHHSRFVETYISKIQPVSFVNLDVQPEKRYELMQQIYTFTQKLSPTFNSQKVSVLFHLLEYEEKNRKYNNQLFLEYLTALKGVRAAPPICIPQRDQFGNLHDPSFNVFVLPIVTAEDHENLTKRFLLHFFFNPDVNDFKEYQTLLVDTYLRDIYIEAKLLSGSDKVIHDSADSVRVAAQIKDRVDIDFLPSNKNLFKPEDDVVLLCDIKNVSTLYVKMFEINTVNFYETNFYEIPVDIDLDGLVPTEEQVLRYTDAPIKKITRELQFPSLKNRRGVFVIEVVGNGKSSRALIKKGYLNYHKETGVAGHAYTVIDENNSPVIGAAGHWFTSNDYNQIIIPHGINPSHIIITKDNFATMHRPFHQNENYHLTSYTHIDGESLVRGRNATILIKPILNVSGAAPVSVEMIENVALVVEFEDGDNIATTKVVDQFELYDERPSTYEFLVTENLRKLVVTLKGRVKTYNGDYTDVSTSSTLAVNSQDSSSDTESAYLRYSKDGYKIVVLGKNGEHKANRVLTIRLSHYYLVNPLDYTLQTDASGTVFLGKLHNVTKVTVEQPQQIWDLSILNQFSYCRSLTAGANELITIPYLGSFDSVKREEFSLLETRSGYYTHDHFSSLHLKDGSIQVQLSQGMYNFRIASQELFIQLQVLPAKQNEERGYITPVGGDTHEYSAVHLRPPFASTATTTDKDIVIKIENARKTTQVAVTAKYFVPLEEPTVPKANETECFNHDYPFSVYVNSRRLGDEYMYILDRKHAKKYPGNHLKRPSPLLAPWEVQSTKTSKQEAELGEPMPCMPAAAPCAMMDYGGMAEKRMANYRARTPLKPTYDFLSSPAATVANLQPDKDGFVKVDRKLVRGSLVTVIVLDEIHTNVRQFGLEDCNLESRDTTLQGGLDPSKHYAEIKLVETLQPNSSLVIKNAGSAAFAIYDTVGKLYSLYNNLVKFPELEEFDFVVRWPSLSDAQKKEKYGKMVSHELNFFLYKKDPTFFESVVKPFISCKKEKTFMDYYLLDAKEELKQYLTVSRFHQLNNIIEKILLGQKFPTESAAIHKLVASLYENKSSDRVEFNKVFDTALKGNAASPPAAQLNAAMSYSANRELAGSFAAAAAPVMHRQRMAAPMSRKAKVFYEPPAKTKEYAETNYYKIKSGNTSELVPVNAFWKDYAVHIANSPDTKFLPKSVSIPATYTDALFSLAVVDLPFNLENAHTMKPDGDSLDIVTATPAVIFHKEVIPAELEQSTIIVSENFFDPENEHKIENGERVQLYVTEEFLVGKVYGSTVTLTNGSSSTQRIETLYQVPQGSIPVKNGSYTKGKFETIRPYSIITFNYFFYFPRPGSFKHFPIHATKDKKVIAAAQPTTLKVVEQFSKNDFTSWEFIAERGSNEQALNFLSTQNITNVNLASIAWRMRDKDFLVAITDLLRKLYVYEDSIWSYGLYHDIPKLVSEYISRQRSFIDCCKPVLHSPLLKVDPEEYNYIYEHLDYFPLINARAHQLGKSRQILNDRFKQQYEKLLHILALKRNNTESDKLAVTSYLILQDRVEEAINYFQTINPTADDDKHVSPLQLQYDYMACYLDLFNDVPTKAPVIAAKYTNYPVPRWNSLFKDIRNKIASITDASIVVQDSTDEERDRDRQQASMAETAPHFTFSVESKQITIDYENIDKCTINYYVMDIEVTFSINPFDRQDLGSYVTPNKHQEVNLPADRKSVTVDLPAEYHNSNIMIDIKAQGIRKSKPYYSHSLNVHVIQNYGQVKVLHSATRKPISKAYVKVYSRQHNNVVTFYKDGYTDLAGTFDYSSLSTDDLDQVSLFAILVVSDQYGAVIVEAAPPAHAH